MKIGGLQKFTLIDYPAKIAATIFTVGCDFRCPFCHNPELVLPEEIKKNSQISEKELFAFLEERRGFLEGICIGGGEPCINEDLPQFCEKIKKMGYLVKLDTNGSRPEMLEILIDKSLVDYVAMDIKAPKEKYQKAAGKKIDIRNIEESIKILKEAKIDSEFRTTVVPNLLKKEDFLEIGQWLKRGKKYFLQQFRPGEIYGERKRTIDSSFSKIKPYSEETLNKFCSILKPYFKICQVRV